MIEGEGSGPLAALVDAFQKAFGISISIRDYHEHAMGKSADAKAAAYVEADVDDEAFWGVGVHGSILTASLRAIVNAVNRAEAARGGARAGGGADRVAGLRARVAPRARGRRAGMCASTVTRTDSRHLDQRSPT